MHGFHRSPITTECQIGPSRAERIVPLDTRSDSPRQRGSRGGATRDVTSVESDDCVKFRRRLGIDTDLSPIDFPRFPRRGRRAKFDSVRRNESIEIHSATTRRIEIDARRGRDSLATDRESKSTGKHTPTSRLRVKR